MFSRMTNIAHMRIHTQCMFIHILICHMKATKTCVQAFDQQTHTHIESYMLTTKAALATHAQPNQSRNATQHQITLQDASAKSRRLSTAACRMANHSRANCMYKTWIRHPVINNFIYTYTYTRSGHPYTCVYAHVYIHVHVHVYIYIYIHAYMPLLFATNTQ